MRPTPIRCREIPQPPPPRQPINHPGQFPDPPLPRHPEHFPHGPLDLRGQHHRIPPQHHSLTLPTYSDHVNHQLDGPKTTRRPDSYWATGRPREQQDRALAESLNFGVYDSVSGEQVAYARIVTDYATFGWLCDVYVDRAVRGKHIGTALITAVRAHLAPFGLRRILLATRDAHGLYEKIGFEQLDDPGKWMVLGRR